MGAMGDVLMFVFVKYGAVAGLLIWGTGLLGFALLGVALYVLAPGSLLPRRPIR